MTAQSNRIDRHSRFSGLFDISSGSRSGSEIWNEVGGPELKIQILDIVEPLTLKVNDWGAIALSQSGLLPDQQDRVLAALESATVNRGGLGVPIALAVAGLQLATGLLSSGNATKEGKRLAGIEARMAILQPVMQEQASRAIALLARAGDPVSIEIIQSAEAGPEQAQQFAADVSQQAAATAVGSAPGAVPGAGISPAVVIGAAGVAAAAARLLRGMNVKSRRVDRRQRMGFVPGSSDGLGFVPGSNGGLGFGLDFRIPTTQIKKIVATVAEQQEAAIVEKTTGPAGSFKPREFFDSVPDTSVSDINILKDAVIKLGLANNGLELILDGIDKSKATRPVSPLGGMGMPRSRVERFRPARLGQTDSDQLQSMRAILADRQGIFLPLLEDLRRVADDRFQFLDGEREVNIVNGEVIELRPDIAEQATWAREIAQWAGQALAIATRDDIPEGTFPTFAAMTKRLTRHMLVVLTAQAKTFRDLGDEENARKTDEAIQLFKNRVSIANQAGAKRAGLSGMGVPLILLLVGAVSGTWLADTIVEAWGGTEIAAANVEIARLQRDTATVQMNTRKIDLDLANALVSAQEQNRPDLAQQIADIGKRSAPTTSMWAEAKDVIASVGKLALLGAGLFVGLKFVLPAVQSLLVKKTA